MSIHISQMKKFIRANGHLILEGDETTEELRQACIHLIGHFPFECQRPEWGTPMGELIPDITWLTPGKRRNFTRVKQREVQEIDTELL